MKKCIECGEDIPFFSRWKWVSVNKAMHFSCYEDFQTRMIPIKTKLRKWKEEGYEVDEIEDMFEQIILINISRLFERKTVL